MVDCIEVRVRNITFVQQYGLPSSFSAGLQQPNADDSDDEAERPFVFCYPPARGLQAEVSPPYRINLSELRTIEIGLKSGWNDILKGALRVKPATAGLRLRITEVSIVDGDLKLEGNAESGQIDFTSFGPNSSARLSIPYTIEDDQTTLSARLEVVYETADCQFSYFSATSIISTLPVSVNVQDIFKDDSLISRFTISPAMATPLRILNCKIPSSEVYEVQPSIHHGQVLDCFPRQSASVLYKITPRGEKALEADASKRSLALTIDFTCLDEECLSVIENRFVQDICASKFAQLARLLTPHLLEAFRSEWTANDMEIISLIREIDILSYERVQWETVTNSLGGKLGKEVVSWLKEWHTVSFNNRPKQGFPDITESSPRGDAHLLIKEPTNPATHHPITPERLRHDHRHQHHHPQPPDNYPCRRPQCPNRSHGKLHHPQTRRPHPRNGRGDDPRNANHTPYPPLVPRTGPGARSEPRVLLRDPREPGRVARGRAAPGQFHR